MKSIVIFDSNFGNTRLIAEAIAAELKTRAIPVEQVDPALLNDIDLLVIGCPIIGWRPTSKTAEFLKKIKNRSFSRLMAATFDTRMKVFYSGNAARKISKSLDGNGVKVISDPQPFYVRGKEGPLLEGEIENARRWANALSLKVLKESKNTF